MRFEVASQDWGTIRDRVHGNFNALHSVYQLLSYCMLFVCAFTSVTTVSQCGQVPVATRLPDHVHLTKYPLLHPLHLAVSMLTEANFYTLVLCVYVCVCT